MIYKIRKMLIKDINNVYEIISQVLKDDFSIYPPRVSLIYRKHILNKKFFWKFLKIKTNTIFGAFIDNKLAGVLVIKGEFGGVVFIEWLAVKKEYRNKGLGKTLLNKGEKWALKHYYHYIYLFTETEKNINYYKKRGFYYVGKHINAWFGATEYLMGKSLKTEPFEEMFLKYS